MEKVLKITAIVLVCVFILCIGLVSFFFVSDLILGVNNIYKKKDGEWQMRKVHNATGLFNFLANGLTEFDLDEDGLSDWYLTQYEMLGNIYVMIRPDQDTVKTVSEWEAMYVGRVDNAESSCFADLNGDGIPEVLVSHGVERADAKSGVTVFQYRDEQWVMLGDISNSESDGHIHFIRAYDMNNDGFVDVICGGRGNTMAGTNEQNLIDVSYAGLFVLINPGYTDFDINLNAFEQIMIDDALESGHGFYIEDINEDGFLDIAVCNSDFNTRAQDKAVYLYINNDGTNYTKKELYKDPELYTKEQVSIGDLNGDGKKDIVFHTLSHIIIFYNNDGQFEDYDTVKIAKPDNTVQRSRMIYLADLNNDGRLDIIGGLIHHNGKLPRSKSSVFWMENKGDGTFTTHTIKLSEGFIGLMEFNGEKWDLCLVADLDGDGDLDIIANCEEYNRLTNIISVVWFENPHIN